MIKYTKGNGNSCQLWAILKKGSKQTVIFSQIRSYIIDDLLDEIKFILNRLKKSGIKKVIIVDLTNPKCGNSGCKGIVPGLETFEVARLFRRTRITIGNRAKISLL